MDSTPCSLSLLLILLLLLLLPTFYPYKSVHLRIALLSEFWRRCFWVLSFFPLCSPSFFNLHPLLLFMFLPFLEPLLTFIDHLGRVLHGLCFLLSSLASIIYWIIAPPVCFIVLDNLHEKHQLFVAARNPAPSQMRVRRTHPGCEHQFHNCF